MGLISSWRVSGITTEGARLSKPIYDFGHGMGKAAIWSKLQIMVRGEVGDGPQYFVSTLASQSELKALYYGIAMDFLALKAIHDEFIMMSPFQANNSRHDQTVKFLVMWVAYAMGHDDIPFDWQAVRMQSQGVYTSLERNVGGYFAQNVPIIEELANEVSKFVVAYKASV